MTYLCKKWAQCLPMWGKVLAHHENAACPGWAELLSKGCPTQAYISMVVFTEFCQYKQIPDISKTPFIFATKMTANKKSHPRALILPFFHTFASIDTAQTVCVAR